MSTNNTKHPNATVPEQNQGQPAYSQVTKTPSGNTVAVNASVSGESPIATNYPHH